MGGGLDWTHRLQFANSLPRSSKCFAPSQLIRKVLTDCARGLGRTMPGRGRHNFGYIALAKPQSYDHTKQEQENSLAVQQEIEKRTLVTHSNSAMVYPSCCQISILYFLLTIEHIIPDLPKPLQKLHSEGHAVIVSS